MAANEATIIEVPTYIYASLLPSSGDEYNTCENAGYYMPPKAYCTRAYCRAVLSGSQPCPQISEIEKVFVKKYDLASISTAMFFVTQYSQESKKVNPYLPKKRRNAKKKPKLHRGWIFSIIHTFAK